MKHWGTSTGTSNKSPRSMVPYSSIYQRDGTADIDYKSIRQKKKRRKRKKYEKK